MTPQQVDHMRRLNERFVKFNSKKFSEGAAEHAGTVLTGHSIQWYLSNMKQEVADLWNYLDTLEEELKTINKTDGL